jgi:drug/metabolite transporter (DMT)-like permease
MFHSNPKIRGATYIVLSCVAFSVMAAFVKHIALVGAFKTSMARFMVGLAILGTAALLGKIRLDFHDTKLLFWRGLIGGAGIVIQFIVIIKIGIGKGTMLTSTYPIFACIFAAILLKEKFSKLTIPAIIGSIAGIYFLTSNGAGSFSKFGFYECLAIFNGIMAGLAITIIRKLHSTDSSYSIFWAQCIIGFWIAFMPANAITDQFQFTWIVAVVLLVIGISATIGQLFMTQGYKYLPVRTGSILGLFEPTFNFFVGAILFGEFITSRSILGAALIVLSSILALSGKRND